MALAKIIPALTPQAMLGLPWRYVLRLLDVASKANQEAIEAGSKGRKEKRAMPCKAGGVYADWYGELLRMGGK